jgi:hypothetical protein
LLSGGTKGFMGSSASTGSNVPKMRSHITNTKPKFFDGLDAFFTGEMGEMRPIRVRCVLYRTGEMRPIWVRCVLYG